ASLVLSHGMRILARNRPASELLLADIGISEDAAEVVQIQDKTAASNLVRAVERASWPIGLDRHEEAKSEFLLGQSSAAKRIVVTVSPVFQKPVWHTRDDLAVAFVRLVNVGVLKRENRLHRLQQLFGLTLAEMEISSDIAAGISISEIASRRQVSPATVRVQMKSIFEKVGVKRQS